ncbi:hypothetical protein DENSPDRAFT_770657 [Dentipellis sp. KUC8613]|nr:hypothetical protein DENSPDRAFT_770657 [Dentipellis sp. KUC8613]
MHPAPVSEHPKPDSRPVPTARPDGAVNKLNTSAEPDALVRIYGARLFDPESLAFVPHPVVTVDPASGLIVDVHSYDPAAIYIAADANTVDLRDKTLLPGFVDAHVHFFLHPYSETPWDDQLTKEHLAERTVRATVHARRTLQAGFTTVRDLGTEGAGDADIALRACLSGPDALIPGPRYFCANRAIVATGSYGPRSGVNLGVEGVDGVTGAEIADGVDGCVRAVRRQIGAGADWIKVHYRVRARTAKTAPAAAGAAIRTFSEAETDALIRTAHQYGVRVAAHASHRDTIASIARQGVDTVEHGFDLSAASPAHTTAGKTIKALLGDAVWVPTLSAFYTIGGNWERAAATFRAALAEGVDAIAVGGDTGVFAHGDNALEMRLMVQLGADWRRVLRWATLGGWRAVRSTAWEGPQGLARVERVGEMREDRRVVGDNEVPFGVVKRGWAADIIATAGDLEGDFEGAVGRDNIVFVMKAGKVYKKDGKEVVDP